MRKIENSITDLLVAKCNILLLQNKTETIHDVFGNKCIK